ncbi:hypothetical protein ABEB36_006924 [Hypothenemus hampei]|uniref:PNPLA domain-containing protein n=1 Tax=Hypothenemus hampei TaxID=57062 RepID=A0ABD1EUF4_HYPHA
MSFNSWKVFNQLKERVTKFRPDKSIQNEFFQLINKLPQTQELGEYLKATEKKINEINQSLGQIYDTALKSNKKQDTEDKEVWKKVKRISQSQHHQSKPKEVEMLDLMACITTEQNLLTAVESFMSFLKQQPEVRNNAIKHGAIRILLNKQLNAKCDSLKGALREALTILGYNEPVSGQGIRILSIDGGGIRGVLVLEMLKKLEELTGKRVYEMFDFFCGVSTGAILTYSMGVHLRKLDDIIARYEALSQEIFNQSPLFGTGKLVWKHAYYDTNLWEKKLKDYLGDQSLIVTSRNPNCPKICVVSAIVNQSQVLPYVFRNYALPWRFQSEYDGTFNAELWQAARASAAAPTYFEEFRINEFIHQDGGILANNPTAIAIHEAKLLWPNSPIQCVISFGTGRSVPSPAELGKRNKFDSNRTQVSGSQGTSWSNKFFKILDSATDTQAVHIMLSDLLSENVYYRFNPYLTEVIGMVETDLEKQKQMKRDVIMYLRRNEDKFHEAAKTLMLKKKYRQLISDKINLQRDLLGL